MVAPYKKKEVETLVKKIKANKVVGVVSLRSMPSRQLQKIRKKLRGEADIYTSKNSLIRLAFEKVGIKELEKYVEGPISLILTNTNPFKLERILYENRAKAAAKPGSIAQADIVVPAGDTGLPAGPVIGEVQNAGIKAQIQGGKIVVKEDTVVAKKGEKINEKVAVVLNRLGIQPNEIQLKMTAAIENGIVYPYEVLHIDEGETLAKIANAYRSAINLSVNAGIFNKESMPYMITEAFSKARNLAINAEIVNKDTVGVFMGKAGAAANALKAVLPPEVFTAVEEKPVEPSQ